MLEQETIEHYQKLLEIHRRNLYHLLEQVALHGGRARVPLEIANNLEQTRADIRRAKEILRANGVVITDLPGDEELPEDHTASVQLTAQALAQRARNRLGLRLTAGLVGMLILAALWHSGLYSTLLLPTLLRSAPADQAQFSIAAQLPATDAAADRTAAPLVSAPTQPAIATSTAIPQPSATYQAIAPGPHATAAPAGTPAPQPAISNAEPPPTEAPTVAAAAAVLASSPPAAKTLAKPTQPAPTVQPTATAAPQIIACVHIDRLYVKQEQLAGIVSAEPRFQVVALFGPVEGIPAERTAANTVPKTPAEDIAGQQIEPQWQICEPINSYIETGNTLHVQIQASLVTPDNQAHVADISPIDGDALNLVLQLSEAGSDCSIWQGNAEAIVGNCGSQIQTIGDHASPLSSDIIPAVGIWFTVTLSVQ